MAVLKLLVLARQETHSYYFTRILTVKLIILQPPLVSLTTLGFVVFSQNKGISVGQTAWRLISNDWLSLVCHCFIFSTLSPPRCQ